LYLNDAAPALYPLPQFRIPLHLLFAPVPEHFSELATSYEFTVVVEGRCKASPRAIVEESTRRESPLGWQGLLGMWFCDAIGTEGRDGFGGLRRRGRRKYGDEFSMAGREVLDLCRRRGESIVAEGRPVVSGGQMLH
jgi:hypothetical protein